MMRDEGQMSSDFQEYTLIALFSLAAHLAGGVAAERASLPAMARYYNQDEDTLNQVRPLSDIRRERFLVVLKCRLPKSMSGSILKLSITA